MTGVGLWQRSSNASDPASSSNVSEKRDERPSWLACGEAFEFSTGRHALGKGMLKLLRIEPKFFCESEGDKMSMIDEELTDGRSHQSIQSGKQ